VYLVISGRTVLELDLPCGEIKTSVRALKTWCEQSSLEFSFEIGFAEDFLPIAELRNVIVYVDSYVEGIQVSCLFVN
jgi:hypothetical protein